MIDSTSIVTSGQVTGSYSPSGSGSTTIISAQADKTIKVSDFYLWNSGTGDVVARLYFASSGRSLFKGKLSSKTGSLKTFFRQWESNTNDSLVLSLDAAGTIDYGVGMVQS